jgi:nitrogen PTS system EIIA component
MRIADFLLQSDAIVDVRAHDKSRLLKKLCNKAASTLKLDADRISADILKREELGSTGVGSGVAIPHARVRDLKEPFGVLARLQSAIDFDAIDGQPVDIIFLLLLPVAPAGEQLGALAAVARKLRDADTVRDLRRASDSTSLYRAMITAS